MWLLGHITFLPRTYQYSNQEVLVFRRARQAASKEAVSINPSDTQETQAGAEAEEAVAYTQRGYQMRQTYQVSLEEHEAVLATRRLRLAVSPQAHLDTVGAGCAHNQLALVQVPLHASAAWFPGTHLQPTCANTSRTVPPNSSSGVGFGGEEAGRAAGEGKPGTKQGNSRADTPYLHKYSVQMLSTRTDLLHTPSSSAEQHL